MSSLKTIYVYDKMQNDYCYELVEPVGKSFEKDFAPFFSPETMLGLRLNQTQKAIAVAIAIADKKFLASLS